MIPGAATLLAAVGLSLLVWTSGCGGGAAPAAIPAPPVTAPVDADLASRWYYAWEREGDLLPPDGRVRDMFFILDVRGREWREPTGPDGYAVRVCLLDAEGRPIRADGALKAFLVYAPFDVDDKKALLAWSIDRQRAGRHFRQDQMPGYLLRLDWDGGSPPPGGEFMLVIRWLGDDGKYRLTRNIVFKDRIDDAISTTTRPAGS